MTKPRVIIADDYPPFLQKLRLLLSAKFDVVAASDCGKCALEAIRRHQPDVAVLDLNMPGLNGIQVIQELASDSRRPKIVICSIETDTGVIEAVRKAGAGAYVVKLRFEAELIPALTSLIEN